MKIEQSGNILFQRGFGTNVGSVTNNVFDYPRRGYDIVATEDNGVMICGETVDGTSFISKFDSQGIL